jgi:dihydroorotase
LGASLGKRQDRVGRLVVGGVADLCVFDAAAAWTVQPAALRSQGKHTPFSGYELPGRVRCTVIGGRVAFQA